MNISVITPTWNRHQLLLERCIPSVASQTIPVNHIISSDGPDPVLRELLSGLPVTYVEAPEHSSDKPNVGARARNYGLEYAIDSTYIAYLDDDNAYRPDHVHLLSEALRQNPEADFAYSRMIRHGLGDEVGSEPPSFGTIDSSLIMHRRDTHLKFGWWPVPSRYEVDWQLIQTWLINGARWVFVPTITVDYYYQPRS